MMIVEEKTASEVSRCPSAAAYGVGLTTDDALDCRG